MGVEVNEFGWENEECYLISSQSSGKGPDNAISRCRTKISVGGVRRGYISTSYNLRFHLHNSYPLARAFWSIISVDEV
jgi:hypothetical protein